MRLIAVVAALLIWCCATARAQQDGAALYVRHCAQCHDAADPQSRVPARSAMQAMSFEHVLGTLATGSMATIAKERSDDERRAIAAFVTGKTATNSAATNAQGRCTQQTAGFPQALDGPRWNGWGVDASNSRFQPAEMAGLTAEQVPRLRLRWAYAFPGASLSFAPPTVVGGLLFIGGTDRKVHALDAKSGCTLWTFATDAAVRAAISFAPLAGTDQFAIFFGDLKANAYAVNALTGAQIWKVKVEEHPAARITGAPTLHSGVLYVPVSSIEEVAGSQPSYECCTFRGSVVALDAATGKTVWQAYTIPEVPHPTEKNTRGTQLYGPSGASVWSAPTIDAKRNAVYIATSNAYSNPPATTADAILALDLATGKLLWKQQATPKDAYVVACYSADKTNCPEDHGPDHDFGQSPILVSLQDGKRMLVIAQKSGVVHALDPDDGGKILWQTRIGKGGPLGGSEWGSAADGARIYVANSDVRFLRDGTRRLDATQGGGLFGLDLASGKIAMEVPPVPCGDRAQCSPALSAAVSVIPGVVFSGSVSGFLRAYATGDGKLLWEFDTAQDYTAVNGAPAHGGAIDGPGPVVADGMLYSNSGYGQWSGVPGNVLLAFDVGKE
ncbi:MULTISPECIES: PQQ-binding-like beta-propeller repeat protein [unclassified Bradyrhizobium]|uniref:outer membrane protein assembly factor BamB family protein n=1 Tax=unclassified Bradyrhizobium TaxID=2631580 RepID=UPI00247B0BF6|nr:MULTISPECIES: PQQ-binding-like beta-propeller repeat protein [unclassified Bradyrhizobium]WGR74291.1 PQQ-binding-like beta-propeller repeat protein [Bradyrhizobium sp. ISRA426]WGR79126.1 PQQ-binding-like beta-propeller repeat protein [Bradyrhizobium sp. ISRA430]WGR89530.1 PQQ-binding-like beta-propeller repeat protein [Bradyrhizobium sp. ISRA432]